MCFGTTLPGMKFYASLLMVHYTSISNINPHSIKKKRNQTGKTIISRDIGSMHKESIKLYM